MDVSYVKGRIILYNNKVGEGDEMKLTEWGG